MNYKKNAYSWLSPSGKFIPVKYSHGSDAYEFTHESKDPIMAAWKLGYMRVTHIGNELMAHNEVMAPNSKQKSALIDLAHMVDMDIVKHDYGDDYKVLWSVHDVMESYNNLSEGAIVLHEYDRKAIDQYISDMRKGLDSIINERGYISENDIIDIAQKLSDKLKSNKFPFEIEYRVRNIGRSRGFYDKTNNIVMIAIGVMCKWAAFKDGYRCVSIDYDLMKEVFIHEFVHYIQHVYRMEHGGEYSIPASWNLPGRYYKHGWERQAHGTEYIQKLKNLFKTKSPQELVNILKNNGLLYNDDLNKLKRSDYSSWKAIMKQAVMNVLGDMV